MLDAERRDITSIHTGVTPPPMSHAECARVTRIHAGHEQGPILYVNTDGNTSEDIPPPHAAAEEYEAHLVVLQRCDAVGVCDAVRPPKKPKPHAADGGGGWDCAPWSGSSCTSNKLFFFGLFGLPPGPAPLRFFSTTSTRTTHKKTVN